MLMEGSINQVEEELGLDLKDLIPASFGMNLENQGGRDSGVF